MALKETIRENLKSALKEKRELEASVIRQILAAILNKEKEKRFTVSKAKPDIAEADLEKESNLTDEEITEVFSSEAKKRRESIVSFEKGKRQDLVEKEMKELEVIKKYLPEQLSEEELKKIVKEAVEKTGVQTIKEMGKVMAELMPKVKGKADGNLVGAFVKELLVK
jgi:uncharacterized protein YqeY